MISFIKEFSVIAVHLMLMASFKISNSVVCEALPACIHLGVPIIDGTVCTCPHIVDMLSKYSRNNQLWGYNLMDLCLRLQCATGQIYSDHPEC